MTETGTADAHSVRTPSRNPIWPYDRSASLADSVVRQHRCAVVDNTKSVYLQIGNAPLLSPFLFDITA